MADKCGYCGERTPTNHLVLNGGNLWIEFCKPCGEKETLINQDGETITIQEIYNKCNDKPTKENKVENI